MINSYTHLYKEKSFYNGIIKVKTRHQKLKSNFIIKYIADKLL